MDIPAIDVKFYDNYQPIMAVLDSYKSKYYNAIVTASNLVNIDASFIASTMFIESAEGKNNGSYIGFMQISVPTAIFTLNYEYNKKRMSKEEDAYLRKLIGNAKADAIKAAPNDSTLKGILSTADVANVPANIFFGSMYMKQCLDKELASTSLEYLGFLRYNLGFFSNLPRVSIAKFQSISSKESGINPGKLTELKAYSLKMFGSTTPVSYAKQIFPS